MEISLAIGPGAGVFPVDTAGAPIAPEPPEEPGSPAAAFAARVAPDAAWSWHLQKTAVFDAVRNRVYSGAASMKASTGVVGSQWILEFDGATGACITRHPVNTGYVADDHNAPALWIEGGRLVVALAGHNDAAHVKVARSSDTNPANLGAFTTLTHGTVLNEVVTYAQIVKLGADLYLMTRVGVTKWAVWKNGAGGDPAAWGAPVGIVTSAGQTYMAARSTGATLAAILWDHPTGGSANQGLIRVAEWADPMAGAVAQESAAVLYTPAAGESTRVLSVNDDCTQVAYAKFTSGAQPASYHLARLTGADRTNAAHWTHEALGITTQRAFWPDSEYIAGVELAGSGATATGAWVAWADPDLYHGHLEHWTRPDAGAAWVKTLIGRSQKQLVRPIVPHAAPRPMALVQSLQAYTDFTTWEIDAFLVPEVARQQFLPSVRFPGTITREDAFADMAPSALLSARAGWSIIEGADFAKNASDGRIYRTTAVNTAALMGAGTVGPDLTISMIARVAANGTRGTCYCLARWQDGANHVQCGVNSNGALVVYEVIAGVATLRATGANNTFAIGNQVPMAFEIAGDQVRGYLNGSLQVTATLTTHLAAGRVGIRNTGAGYGIGDFGVVVPG